MSKTLANIRDDLSIKLGDYLHSTVTTALTTDNNLVDTNLANEEGGTTDNYFKNWWVLVTSGANDGEIRRVSTYTASTKTIVVAGSAWSSDGATLATYELHRHNPTKKKQAINIACRKSELWADVLSYDLETGNVLPNSNFDWWTSSSALKLWQTSNVTLARNSTAPYLRSGSYSAKLTASAANGYIELRAREWPRLQDLAGETVTFEAWALPEVANDAFIRISYTDSAGASQTKDSTTTSVAGVWTLLKITDYTIPEDSTDISFRLVVKTNTKYVYYDSARVLIANVRDYLLPEAFQDGMLDWVRVQTGGRGNYDRPSDETGYDSLYYDIFRWQMISDGTYKYLRTPSLSKGYRIELRGSTPLNDTLSADTDTLDIDADRTEYLVAMAARELYMMERGLPSSQSSDLYEKEIVRLDNEIISLKSKMGQIRTSQIRIR